MSLRASEAPPDWRTSTFVERVRSHKGAVVEDDIERAARAKKGSPFLSTEQAAFYLGLSARKMQALRRAGEGPRYRRHCRYIRYHIDDLDSCTGASGAAPNRG
jgi:hypothetical protein